MKRARALEAYADYSAKVSEGVRRLSFAALAVVWVFRPPDSFALPQNLVWAGALSVAALALDFFHSLYGTVAWGAFHRRKELAGVREDEEFKAPRQLNWPTNALFGLKVVALAASYVVLLRHFVDLLTAT